MQKRRCSKCGKNRQEKFFSSRKARVCDTCKKASSRKSARKSHLGSRYEIEPEEYDALLEFNAGACWLCDGKRPYSLPVDHDHAKEEAEGVRKSVRGLLCKRCNKLLRDVRDDADLLDSAIAYLNNGWYQAQLILEVPAASPKKRGRRKVG